MNGDAAVPEGVGPETVQQPPPYDWCVALVPEDPLGLTFTIWYYTLAQVRLVIANAAEYKVIIKRRRKVRAI